MSYEELTLSGFMKEMQEVSSGPHPRKFCFVLGAGASKSSGIKSGQELVNIWEGDLLERNREAHLEWKRQLGINDKNKYEFYSQYYERRFKKAIDGYNYLEKLMESAKPSIGYVILSYILAHTNHNIVITTNFDHLLEDAVNYYENIIPLVIGHESLAHYITKQINRPTIIKIHRDLLLDPKNTASELNVLHENWKKALDVVFSEYYPIFIGYAGNDHSLMDYLTQNKDVFSDEKGIFPYWMIYKTDKMSEMVREFLDRSGGYLIKHSGFDEVLCLLGDRFGYKLPSKEDFISDAERRYRMLSDSMDAFTEAASPNQEIDQEENDTADGKATEKSEVEMAVQSITSQTEMQSMFKKAVQLFNEKKYQDAVGIFGKLIEKDSHNARYYSWLGVTLQKLGCYEKALKEKRKAQELDPENAEYHYSLGITLHKLGRYEEDLKETQKALELDPENAAYHYSLGVTLNKLGRYEEDLKETQKALELEPENAGYHYSLGATLNKLGRYEEALKEIQKAQELDPGNAEYHYSLGVTLQKLGRYEEALEEIQKALELEPENAAYHDSLGVTLHEMGRYEEALKEMRKSLELDSENAKYHNNLGVTLHKLGRCEEALEEIQKALELEPENAEYHAWLGVTLNKLGRYEEALEEIQKALELEPGNAEYHKILGAMLDKLGRYEEAQKEKQRASKLAGG